MAAKRGDRAKLGGGGGGERLLMRCWFPFAMSHTKSLVFPAEVKSSECISSLYFPLSCIVLPVR